MSVKGALAKKVMDTCFIHIETKAGMEEDGQEQRIHVQQKDKVVEFVWQEAKNFTDRQQ